MSAKTFAPFFRTGYNYDTNQAGDESGLSCPDPTRAQQQFKDESDINTLVRRFGVTGKIPVSPLPPQYGDFTGISDFHEATNAIAAAHESFEALPAALRARFHNNPGEFVDFATNASNRAELEKLGLLIPTPQPAPKTAGDGLLEASKADPTKVSPPAS